MVRLGTLHTTSLLLLCKIPIVSVEKSVKDGPLFSDVSSNKNKKICLRTTPILKKTSLN